MRHAIDPLGTKDMVRKKRRKSGMIRRIGNTYSSKQHLQDLQDVSATRFFTVYDFMSKTLATDLERIQNFAAGCILIL